MVRFTSIIIPFAISLPIVTAVRSQTSTSSEYPVYGWCDFTWDNTHKISHVQCGAKDQSCDAHPVYAELVTYANNAATSVAKVFARHDNNAGCGTTNWDNTQHSWDSLPRGNQFKARVKACVNIQFGVDQCYYGNWVDNPYA